MAELIEFFEQGERFGTLSSEGRARIYQVDEQGRIIQVEGPE